LTKHGYRVSIAVDGEDAVGEVQATEKVDLLVMDSVMPGTNGREAYEAITGITPGMKVIFMSGYTGMYPRKGYRGEGSSLIFSRNPWGPTSLKMVRDGAGQSWKMFPAFKARHERKNPPFLGEGFRGPVRMLQVFLYQGSRLLDGVQGGTFPDVCRRLSTC
jgi:CheY-like chemotaxis protein